MLASRHWPTPTLTHSPPTHTSGVHVGSALPPQARFKYPPHWVSVPTLHAAMAALDPVTQQPRGYMLMSAQPLQDSVLFTLDLRSTSGAWRPADAFVRGEDACLQLQVGGGGLGGLVYVSLAGSLTLMMLTSGCTWVQSVVLPGGGHLTVCK